MEITASVELQSNTSCKIELTNQPTYNIPISYDISDFALQPKLAIDSISDVYIRQSNPPYYQQDIEYEIYGSVISTTLSIDSSISCEIKETLKPCIVSDIHYELYSLRITAEINISKSFDLNIDEISSPKTSTGIKYYLEDYPGYIKIGINIIPETSLDLTYLANNKSIMVLDPELNLLTFLDDIEYFSWTRRWRRPDSFKLKMNRYKDNAEYLKVDNYLVKKTGDVLRGGRIRDRKIKVNDQGISSEVWEIKGRGFGDIFNQRLALNDINEGNGFDTLEGPAETVMKYYVDVNTVSPDDPKRKIPNLEIEEDKGLGKTVKYKARFQKLSDILYDISRVTGLGWDIKFDLSNKEFIFQVLYAELKPEIRLSTNTDSVKRIKFAEDHLDSVNTAVVAGQGEGSNRMVVKVTEDDL